MLFDPRKNQWWNAPPEQTFEAYYMTLRVHYGMYADEAFAMAKRNMAAWGGRSFMDALRSAVRSDDQQ